MTNAGSRLVLLGRIYELLGIWKVTAGSDDPDEQSDDVIAGPAKEVDAASLYDVYMLLTVYNVCDLWPDLRAPVVVRELVLQQSRGEKSFILVPAYPKNEKQ